MKYSVYKPNSKNTGCLFSFEIGNTREGSIALFVSAVQQSGWNDKNKTGSFKENAKNPQKSTTIKISVGEAGEFLSSFKTRVPFTAFHKNNEDTTIISLTPWDKERKIKSKDKETSYTTNAFGISISKNSASNFKIALEAGETEVLSLLLKEFISQSLIAEKENYKKQLQNSNNQERQSSSQSTDKSEDSSSFEEDDDDVPF